MAGDASNKRGLPANVDNLEGICAAELVLRIPALSLQTPFTEESRFPDSESAEQTSESRQDKLT